MHTKAWKLEVRCRSITIISALVSGSKYFAHRLIGGDKKWVRILSIWDNIFTHGTDVLSIYKVTIFLSNSEGRG